MTSSIDIKRVVLVTGANQGIGFALSQLLAEDGHIVYLGSRKVDAGKKAQADLKKEHNLDVKFVQLDVMDTASIEVARDVIEAAEGRLDVLVNNAAVALMDTPQDATSIKKSVIQEVLDANLLGVIETTTTFLPLIRKSNRGVSAVVNISSGMGSNAGQADSATHVDLWSISGYRVSKAAMNSYTIQLAFELKKEGIKVNSLCPGLVSTGMNGFAPSGATPREAAKFLSTWTLLGPEDEAKTGQFFNASGPLPW